MTVMKLDATALFELSTHKPDKTGYCLKRPKSAFTLFSLSMQNDDRERRRSFTGLGEQWHNLSEDEKKPFKSLANEQKRIFRINIWYNMLE